jgi:hypothetical protein
MTASSVTIASFIAMKIHDLINKMLAQMRTEITRQSLRISDNEIMKTVIKNGRYKDKTLKQVLDNPTNEDLLAMMAEMLQYPATYYGKGHEDLPDICGVGFGRTEVTVSEARA